MRAALIRRLGGEPELDSVPEPTAGSGRALIEVRAAALNPVNLSVANGRYHAGTPDFPYIPGTEGAGVVLAADTLAPGTRVRFEAQEREGGALAERVSVREEACFELPESVDLEVAAALGVAGLAAWLSLTVTAPLQKGERVLVLGATGMVGQVAIQACRLLGAGRIVAAGRDARGLERCLELGAHATVTLAGQSAEEMQQLFSAAAQGTLSYCLDGLWGLPAAAAAMALGVGGRLVNLGQSAGPESTISSAAVRGKLLRILGHSNPALAPAVRAAGFSELLRHHAEGRITLPIETSPLSRVAEAWARQASSPHAKLVVVPGG